MAVSLGELAVRFGCELRGEPGVLVEHVATLAGADERSLSFLANSRYKPQLAQTKAAVVVLDAASAAECPTAALICANPYVTYARIAAVLPEPRRLIQPGVARDSGRSELLHFGCFADDLCLGWLGGSVMGEGAESVHR